MTKSDINTDSTKSPAPQPPLIHQGPRKGQEDYGKKSLSP